LISEWNEQNVLRDIVCYFPDLGLCHSPYFALAVLIFSEDGKPLESNWSLSQSILIDEIQVLFRLRYEPTVMTLLLVCYYLIHPYRPAIDELSCHVYCELMTALEHM